MRLDWPAAHRPRLGPLAYFYHSRLSEVKVCVTKPIQDG